MSTATTSSSTTPPPPDYLVNHTYRGLTDDKINHIANIHHAWQYNEVSREEVSHECAGVPNFCKSANLEESRRHLLEGSKARND